VTVINIAKLLTFAFSLLVINLLLLSCNIPKQPTETASETILTDVPSVVPALPTNPPDTSPTAAETTPTETVLPLTPKATSTITPTTQPISTTTSTSSEYFFTGCLHSDDWIPKHPGQAEKDDLGCWDLGPNGFITNDENVLSIRPPANSYDYWIYYPISENEIEIQFTIKFYNLSDDYLRIGFSGDGETPDQSNSILSFRQSGTSTVSATYRNSSNETIAVFNNVVKFPQYVTVIIENGIVEIELDDKHNSPPWRVSDIIQENETGFWIKYYVLNGLSFSVDVNDLVFKIE